MLDLFKFTGMSAGLWEEIEPVPAIFKNQVGEIVAVLRYDGSLDSSSYSFLFSGESGYGYKLQLFPGKRLLMADFDQLTILTDDCLMEV